MEQFALHLGKRIGLLGLICVCVLVTEQYAQTHTIYLTTIQGKSFSPKKGVAWAYGRQNIGDEKLLSISSYHQWGIGYSGIEGLDNLNHFWSDCYPSPSDCQVDYWNSLNWLGQTGNYNGMVTYNDQPIVMLLNEPDLPQSHGQSFKSPKEAAEIYARAKLVCPVCAFFGIKVSAHDMFCDYPNSDNWEQWHYRITSKHDNWCYFREWWQEVVSLTGQKPDMTGYNIHHYYSIDWHHPKRNLSPLEPIDSLEWVVKELGDEREYIPFIIAELGTCNPVFMRELVEAYESDSRVYRYYGWTPNRPNNDACEVFFKPFGSNELTEIGKAFAEN